MSVRRLTDRDGAALEELLLLDPLVNLFLLGYTEAVPTAHAYWYGAFDEDRLTGVVLLVPGRLLVPFAPDPTDADALGALLVRRHRPTMVVGPREAADTIWARWGDRATVDHWHDQRLYTCDTPVEGPPVPGFRRARLDELGALIGHSAAMEEEDIGRRPLDDDPVGYAAVVKRRIEQGHTWVIARDGAIVFQINVGTVTRWGMQVGGTYVPPEHRGQGLATQGMRALTRQMLPGHRCITLHVNEANTPAVRTYERSGFTPHAAYRLLTLAPRR